VRRLCTLESKEEKTEIGNTLGHTLCTPTALEHLLNALQV